MDFDKPVDELTDAEIGMALYHIAKHTDVARDFTVKFMVDVQLAAHERLYKPTLYKSNSADYITMDGGFEGVVEASEAENNLRGDWSTYVKGDDWGASWEAVWNPDDDPLDYRNIAPSKK